jgi:hypothetical protein
VLSRYRGFLSTGLRIDHTVPVYPDMIVFWVAVFLQESRFALLKEKLEDFGYEVNLRTTVGSPDIDMLDRGGWRPATCRGALLLLGIARANAADKMTRKQAEYQDTPNGIYSCGLCSLFEAPNGCKVVEGEVSKDR